MVLEKFELPVSEYKEVKPAKKKTANRKNPTTKRKFSPDQESSNVLERLDKQNIRSKEGENKKEEKSVERKRVVGVTGTCKDSSIFSGAPKRVWLYVGHVGENVQEAHIESQRVRRFKFFREANSGK